MKANQVKKEYIRSEAAKKWLNENGVDDKNIILYGESLGTAVAVDLSKNNFAGIIWNLLYFNDKTCKKNIHIYQLKFFKGQI